MNKISLEIKRVMKKRRDVRLRQILELVKKGKTLHEIAKLMDFGTRQAVYNFIHYEPK